MRANGLIVTCKGTVYTNGPTEEFILANIQPIKNMVMESIHGKVVEDMMDTGIKENNTVLVCIYILELNQMK